jgi:hypothetical protein
MNLKEYNTIKLMTAKTIKNILETELRSKNKMAAYNKIFPIIIAVKYSINNTEYILIRPIFPMLDWLRMTNQMGMTRNKMNRYCVASLWIGTKKMRVNHLAPSKQIMVRNT